VLGTGRTLSGGAKDYDRLLLPVVGEDRENLFIQAALKQEIVLACWKCLDDCTEED
jgi:hypothetical protein